MIAAVAILLAGLAVFGLVLLARSWQADEWARSLVGYRLWLPRELSTGDVAAWLAQLGAQTIPPRFSLLPWWPVCLEVEATDQGITHTVLTPKGREAALLASLRAALPGVRAEVLAAEQVHAFQVGEAVAAAELRLTSHTVPLGDDRAAVAANGLLAAMQPLPFGASARLQLLFAGVRARKEVTGEAESVRRLLDMDVRERDAIRDQRRKQRAPLLLATSRVFVSGPTRDHAYGVLHRIVAALRVLEGPGAHFLWRRVPSTVAERRTLKRHVPFLSWPLTVNTLEAVGLVAFPLDGAHLQGVRLGSSRLVPPAPDMPTSGLVIGEATYPGAVRPLALRTRDRLMHTYVLGPSGVGKSTLLANMALQDIVAGHGVVVIDPKTDLVRDILARFPENRRDDLVVLNAADLVSPVGFNPLRSHGGEHARELAAETTEHILRSIFREYWGPRTDDLLRAALLSLVHVPAPNGEAFTMCEVAELLTNAGLRRYVMRSSKLHDRWRQYWAEYDARSEAEQLNMVGPVLNKLRAFTHRTSLRLVLGQRDGFDIAEVFTKRKVLLVPLAQGQIGVEAATLLGSLLVGALWQATLARSVIEPERRRPVFAYLDEFQNIVKISDDLTDALAQARGLGLGFVLAHQYAKQVPAHIQAAVLGTVRSQIFFQSEYDDARLVARRLQPILTADDLMGLPAYEVIARLCVNGQTRSPVSGRTFALPDAFRDVEAVGREVAERYGQKRADIEAAIVTRTQARQQRRTRRFGEVPTEGGDA
jgi:hypothetical protein